MLESQAGTKDGPVLESQAGTKDGPVLESQHGTKDGPVLGSQVGTRDGGSAKEPGWHQHQGWGQRHQSNFDLASFPGSFVWVGKS